MNAIAIILMVIFYVTIILVIADYKIQKENNYWMKELDIQINLWNLLTTQKQIKQIFNDTSKSGQELLKEMRPLENNIKVYKARLTRLGILNPSRA